MSDFDNKQEFLMTETTTPADSGSTFEAVSEVGGVPIDANGNALASFDDEPAETTPSDESPTEAAEVSQETSTESPEVEATATVSDDQRAWAKNKGIELSDTPTPAEIKAIELARESERQFHQDRSKTSELQKTLKQFEYQQPPAPAVTETVSYDEYGNEVTTPSTVNQGLDPRDLKMSMLEFRVNHADYEPGSDLDLELGKIVGENVPFWTQNLDQAYRIAKANLSEASFESKIEAAKEQARSEERERLTRQSRTAQPTAQVSSGKSNAEVITSANVDEIVGRHAGDAKWYEKHLPEINKAIGSN